MGVRLDDWQCECTKERRTIVIKRHDVMDITFLLAATAQLRVLSEHQFTTLGRYQSIVKVNVGQLSCMFPIKSPIKRSCYIYGIEVSPRLGP